MNAVWFIFCIGLLNACLGFAIALHLGRRYRASLPPDWDFDNGLSWSEESETASPRADAEEASDETPHPDLNEASEPAEDDRGEEWSEASGETVGDLAERMQARADEILERASEPEDALEALEESAYEADGEPELEPEPTLEAESEPELEAEVAPESEREPEPEPEALAEVASELGQPDAPPSDAVALSEEEPRPAEEAEYAAGQVRADAPVEPLAEPELPAEQTSATISEEPEGDAPRREAVEIPEASTAESEAAQGLDGLDDAASEDGEPAAVAEPEIPDASATSRPPIPAEEDVLRALDREARAEGELAAAPRADAGFDGNADADLAREPSARSSTGDAAIEAFLAEVEQYQKQLGQADIELRAQAADPDGDSIRACLESLLEASREFAVQREQAQVGLGDVWGETSEFGVARNRLEGALIRQDAQIESTERAVAAFPYVHDLSQGCRVMIGETTKLMDANLFVRDSLQEVGIGVARGENRLRDLEPGKRRDALTGVESREALEGVLLEWMEADEERPAPLSVAAIDIDSFSRVNEEYGHAVGNQLLHALGKLLAAENGNRARLARFSGERFVLLFPKSDLRATTNAVERLRQIVELACFEYKKSEIHVTVSCGVAEAGAEDTPEAVMTRAEATLMEAKRYGRNRTFIHEGKYPTPVVPPKFPIESRRMSL